jgi:hypothetical protein
MARGSRDGVVRRFSGAVALNASGVNAPPLSTEKPNYVSAVLLVVYANRPCGSLATVQ